MALGSLMCWKMYMWKKIKKLRVWRSRPEPPRWFTWLPMKDDGVYHRTKLGGPVHEQFEVYEAADGQALMHYPRSTGMKADLFPDLATAKAAAAAVHAP